jgi:hypothetical protein
LDAHIGIWWDDGQTLAAITHSPAENSSRQAGFIDSNLNHVDEWPGVAQKFGKTARDEYFIVPRGRVILHGRTGRGVIYHGTGTSAERLKPIAAAFNLANWKAVVDLHYETGAALDDIWEYD